jgi:hypothetical protein
MKLNERLNELDRDEVDRESKSLIEQLRSVHVEMSQLIAEIERLRYVRIKLDKLSK